jgi:hypothetical protein
VQEVRVRQCVHQVAKAPLTSSLARSAADPMQTSKELSRSIFLPVANCTKILDFELAGVKVICTELGFVQGF